MMHSLRYWFKTKVCQMRLEKERHFPDYSMLRCLKTDDKNRQCRKGDGHITAHRYDKDWER